MRMCVPLYRAQWVRIFARKSLARSDCGLVKKVSGSVDSTIRPPSMKTTRLAARRAKPISWVTTTIVMPSRASPIMTSRTSLIISGSSAEVGSSNSMTFGSIARARAMATRCCCPPDSWAGYLSACALTPTRSRSSRARFSASAFGIPRTLIGPRVTFCRIVLCAKRLKLWNTMPTSLRRRASCLPSSGIFSPSMVISPFSIDSRRLIVRHRVDFPEPDGPMTMTTSPRAISRSMSCSTCSSPNHLLTPDRRTRGSPFELVTRPTLWGTGVTRRTEPSRRGNGSAPDGRVPDGDNGSATVERREPRSGRRNLTGVMGTELPPYEDLAPVRTYRVRTYGCQMNVHDSERLSGLLEEAGYTAAAEGADADVVVLNTCAVRENADNRLYGNLGHLRPVKDARPGMQIAVGGCLAQKG